MLPFEPIKHNNCSTNFKFHVVIDIYKLLFIVICFHLSLSSIIIASPIFKFHSEYHVVIDSIKYRVRLTWFKPGFFQIIVYMKRMESKAERFFSDLGINNRSGLDYVWVYTPQMYTCLSHLLCYKAQFCMHHESRSCISIYVV